MGIRNTLYLVMMIVILVLGLAVTSNLPEIADMLKDDLETVVILKEAGTETADLPSTEQGTVHIVFRAVPDQLDVDGSTPTKIQLFKSKSLAGLIIYYLYDEQKLSGGLPEMLTSEIDLLDGNIHEIIYTFRQGDRQLIYVDGQLLAEGDYDNAVRISLTGFAVSQPENEIEKQIDGAYVTVSDDFYMG